MAGNIRGLKGHESIAQALAWVSYFQRIRPEGAAENRLPRYCGISVPFKAPKDPHISQTDRGSKSAIIRQERLAPSCPLERKIICMRSVSTLIAGLLIAGTLALAPDTSFARGGGGGGHSGGGGHFGGGHFGGGHHFGGFRGGFHSRGFGFGRHSNLRFYGFYGPFGYDLDDYAGPYDDDNDAFEVSGTTSDESTSLTISVQKELTQLGYYRGPIDGIAGSQTAQAVRWFQSVNHLPVTGQIDSETVEAMRIG
jgi:Putative peptidoglycan binding domain